MDGHLRTSFRDEKDLEEAVRAAVAAQGELLKIATITAEDLKADLSGSRVRQDLASLRVVLAPQRDEDVIDIVKLVSAGFRDEVYRISHEPGVGLFDYEAAKKKEDTDEGVLFSQQHHWGEHSVPEAHLEIRTNGRLIIDRQVSSLGDRGGLSGLSILEPDLIEAIRSSLAFANLFYDHFDQHKRHSRFWFAVTVANRGSKLLAAEAPHGSVSMGIRTHEPGPVAAETPRLINRSDLAKGGEIVERALTHFRRKLSG